MILLNLLEGVRQTGPQQWVARCPSHKDKSPSLSVKECSDGRVLLHCFAGCDTHDILGALNLEIGDLFPQPIYHRGKAVHPRFSAGDALKCLSREAGVVAIIASDLAEGRPVDADRAATAAGRIADALAVVYG